LAKVHNNLWWPRYLKYGSSLERSVASRPCWSACPSVTSFAMKIIAWWL